MDLTVDDVDPLILVVVQMARPAEPAVNSKTHIAPPVSLEDTLQSFGSPPSLMCSSNRSFPAATLKPANISSLFIFLFLSGARASFRWSQSTVASGEVFLQNRPMRLEGADLLEISPAEDSFDLLQLDPQLPVEQDLLESQELWLFVESVAMRAVTGGLSRPVSS
jgi:hypothetical protein